MGFMRRRLYGASQNFFVEKWKLHTTESSVKVEQKKNMLSTDFLCKTLDFYILHQYVDAQYE